MVAPPITIRDDYWEKFVLHDDDVEFLHNHLLDVETPLTPEEMVDALIADRIKREKNSIEKQQISGGELYKPKGSFQIDQILIFPSLGWKRGQVVDIRKGNNPEIGSFQVINVDFEGDNQSEFAANLSEHTLNDPLNIAGDVDALNPSLVKKDYLGRLIEILEEYLKTDDDFVRIAWKWFPRALLVDISEGHLNLAEAVLDIEEGGPLPTEKLIDQVEIAADVNPKLVEFSFDLALQEDPRFDEVGPAGDVLWYLQRLEPPQVQETPQYLRYTELEYDPSSLTETMLFLERDLDDELSVVENEPQFLDEVSVRLIFPHWITGSLPLSSRVHHLFPTAYEAPRIQFTIFDGNSGEKYPSWVVREKGYVYGLSDLYEKQKVMPGSILRVSKGDNPGEVIVHSDSQKSKRDWVRTVLVGSDGGVVFAMLKQAMSTPVDDRMAIAVPDKNIMETIWNKMKSDRPPFERVVVDTVKKMAALNPQNHVHASELYAAVNVVMRCPPGPILSLLASRPWFNHVGDLHYRLDDSEIA